MWSKAIIFVISAAVVLGCSSRQGTPRTLQSGKEVRLLFADVVQARELARVAAIVEAHRDELRAWHDFFSDR